MPTPAPCSRMACRVASTSSWRRARRCSSQRELRPSGVVSVAPTPRTVAGTASTCYLPYRVPRPRRGRRPAAARTTHHHQRNQGARPVTSTRRAAVLGGNRIPFARQFGAYAEASNQDMLTAALEGLIARHGLAGERLGEVVAGAVIKHSRDFNLTREAVLGSSLAPTTPAYDVTQACGTGLEAAILVANKIALGGVDSASDAPVVVPEKLRRKLLRLNRAKSQTERAKAALAFRPTDVGIQVPANTEPRTGLSMG